MAAEDREAHSALHGEIADLAERLERLEARSREAGAALVAVA